MSEYKTMNWIDNELAEAQCSLLFKGSFPGCQDKILQERYIRDVKYMMRNYMEMCPPPSDVGIAIFFNFYK